MVFTLEDHAVTGGFGSAVLEHANAAGLDANNLELIGIPDRFIDHGQRIEALAAAGIDVPGIVARVCLRLGLEHDPARISNRLEPAGGTISPAAFDGAQKPPSAPVLAAAVAGAAERTP